MSPTAGLKALQLTTNDGNVRSGLPKVAFYVYPTAFQAPGGGEIQLLKTKEYLEKQGVMVKLFDPWRDKLKSFDILHTFGSVKDCLPMMRIAHRQGVKTVLSTICWYSWRSAWGTPASFFDRGLSMSRHLAKVLFPFLPSARRKMMELSDLLLPNSQSEAEQLQRFFRVPKEKIKTVPNGVDPSFADAKPDLFCSKYGIRDFVLTVGRIEPRKNQLQMIRALKGVKIPYVIIGDPVTQYWDYYRCCQTESGSNVHFLSALRHDSPLLASSYAACKVFLLASWLETPGLAAMEAALAGAKLVITNQGAAPEYFQDFASYVSPWSLSEIRETTLKALSLPSSLDLKNHVALHYLWNEVAVRTQDCYRSLMF